MSGRRASAARSTRVLTAGRVRTLDLGGTASTTEFTEAVCREESVNERSEGPAAQDTSLLI